MNIKHDYYKFKHGLIHYSFCQVQEKINGAMGRTPIAQELILIRDNIDLTLYYSIKRHFRKFNMVNNIRHALNDINISTSE